MAGGVFVKDEGKFSVGVETLEAIVLSDSDILLGSKTTVLDTLAVLLESLFVGTGVDWTTGFVGVGSITWTDEIVSIFNVDVE